MDAKAGFSLMGAELGEVSSLFGPWRADFSGRLRPPLSPEAMKLSAALAYTAYTMDAAPWLNAGWRDVTAQVDGEVVPLTREGLQSAWRKRRVLSKVNQGPLGQAITALRQKDRGATGKAIVMLKEASNGRVVVAVGFMGTGRRYYDWFSNLRMTTENGMHRGFLELARQFEQNEERIAFPETARKLGLETLTLSSILRDLRRPDSRYLLWLSGHSQGAAVMQTYAHLKLHEDGVYPANLLGWGFASPTVMTDEAVADPGAYPLYHVLNSDDLVPRCGASVHLGLTLTYPAEANLRKSCYAWPREEASVKARLAVRPLLRGMTDTPACLMNALAFLTLLSRRSASELLSFLGMDALTPLDRLVDKADPGEWIDSVRLRAMGAYQSITGNPPDHGQIEQITADMQGVIDEIGFRAFREALNDLTRYPHAMRPDYPGGFEGAYPYIVQQGIEKLIPALWVSGAPAARRTGPTLEQRQRELDPALLFVSRWQRKRRPPFGKVRGRRKIDQSRRHVPWIPLFSR